MCTGTRPVAIEKALTTLLAPHGPAKYVLQYCQTVPKHCPAYQRHCRGGPMREGFSGPLIGPSAALSPAVAVLPYSMAVIGSVGSAGPVL